MKSRYDKNKDLEKVLKKYTLLKHQVDHLNTTESLFGEIELVDEQTKTYIDTFAVEIIIPRNFPFSFPLVIEKEEKIPRCTSRHVIPGSNTLCLALKLEERLLCLHGITLLWFIDHVLVPRLCEEYRVNRGGKYQKEYSHEISGTWEYLMKRFETKDQSIIIALIGALAYKKTPKGNQKCLCGSGKFYRECHKPELEKLKHLGNETISKLFEALNKTPYAGVDLS